MYLFLRRSLLSLGYKKTRFDFKKQSTPLAIKKKGEQDAFIFC
jgi:hypothetical protein